MRRRPLTRCVLLALLFAWSASGATTNNDDSCDIGVAPAATLLLPYFEVDLDDPDGETTVFTITNVTDAERIARVTLWTDYAFPVVTFNVPLAGYGVQSISLYDVIARGVTPRPNPAGACGGLPGVLPAEYVAYMRSAFLEGVVPASGDRLACNNVGNEHDSAVGYATVDLVGYCSPNNPLAEQYWTEDIAFDNVLIGDYQQISSASNFAQGSPMVHIRAIPEGGTPAERMAHLREHGSNFPRTFYGRYQPAHAPKLDSRQPLPSVFAVRWIAGRGSGLESMFKIWREGRTGPGVTCATHDDNVTKIREAVLFDEAENAVGDVPVSRVDPILTTEFTLPATSMTSVTDSSIYPQLLGFPPSGWLYLNLDNSEYDASDSSNWVVVSMRAWGRFSVDVDAASLGNGCSPPTGPSEVTIGNEIIGPRPNVNP